MGPVARIAQSSALRQLADARLLGAHLCATHCKKMSDLCISIIAAIGKNRELGKDNKLLWHIPADFVRFKKITTGHPVIMGRKTYESIGKPLPDRTNMVVTRDVYYHAPGCTVCHSLQEALEKAKKKDSDEIFIIGGGQLYSQAMKVADKLYLTLVNGTFDADTFFPDYSRFKKTVYKQTGVSGNFSYTFLELVPTQKSGIIFDLPGKFVHHPMERRSLDADSIQKKKGTAEVLNPSITTTPERY